jgi:hypothetical protein
VSPQYSTFTPNDSEIKWDQINPEEHIYYPGIQDKKPYAIKVDFDGGTKQGRLLIIGLHAGELMEGGGLDVIHESQLHGQSGVYFYMRHLTEVDDPPGSHRPHVYAGQAAHLGSRAGNKARLRNKNIVVFVGLKPKKCANTNYDLDEMLDENWRQHLEHLMIRWLCKQSVYQNISVENGRSEHASKSDQSLKKNVRIFFDSMIDALNPLKIWGLSTNAPITFEGSDTKQPIWYHKRVCKGHYKWSQKHDLSGKAEFYAKNSVGVKNSSGNSVGLNQPQIYLVKKGSYAVFKKDFSNRNPQGGIDLKLLYFKESLINSNSVAIEKIDQLEVLRFQEDVLLSENEFLSVVFHNKDKNNITLSNEVK